MKFIKVTDNKKIEMVAVKELLALTGYVRGGCSPVGMKKKFPTFINDSCRACEKITVSAGMKGCQLLLATEELVSFTEAKVCDLVK